MTVLERPPDMERTRPLEAPEAIFPEARRRGRRRRAFTALAAIASGGALAAVIVAVLGNTSSQAGSHTPLVPGSRSGSDRAPAAVVAWADYAGVLHVGDLATRGQLQVATHPAANVSTDPAVVDGGRLLWVDVKDQVRSVELATGRVSVVARGIGVTASPDGTRLYVDQGARDFLELNARTLRVTRRVALPAGWQANPWVVPVAGGLLLTHSGKGTVFGIWRPGGKVLPLRAATYAVLDVYTPPTAGYSLVAWVPRCANHHAGFGSGCPLAITNTVTGRTVAVQSPTRYGFTGGAFSPDGSELAIFVNTDNPSDSFSTPHSELALINTATGALRLDPKVKMITTEDAAWALWLPPGRQLLTGAISATYLVDARGLATRPFYFDGGDTRSFSIMSSHDLNFSTLVVAPSALNPQQRRSLGLTKAPKNAG
jgi:hypothetical protein